MKAVKWIAGIILGILVLVVLGLAALVVFVDPNEYRPLIARKVQEATGRTMEIPGELSWSFYPRIGVQTGKLVLGNAPGFEDKPFAVMEKAKVYVALLPLFKGRIQVATVVLQGLELNLARNAQGRTNWDDLAAGGSREQSARKQGKSSESGEAKALPALAVEGVKIEDADITWQDMAADQKIQLTGLGLDVSSFSLGEPFTVLMSGRIATDRPQTATDFKLSAQPTVFVDQQSVTIRNFILSTDSQGDVFPGKKAAVECRMDMDLNPDEAEISGFELSAYGIRVLAEVVARMGGNQPDVVARIQMPEYSPKALLTSLGMAPPQTADPDALTMAAANATVTMKQGVLSLEQTQRLDRTTMKVQARVLDFNGPVVRFDVAVNEMDVDRYLPPKKAGETASADEKKPVSESEEESQAVGVPLPVDRLRTMDVQGHVLLERLKVKNVRVQDIDATLKAENGVLSLDPLTATAYQGRVEARTVLDVRSDTPAYTVFKKVTGFQVGPYLKDFVGKDHVTGTASAVVDMQGQGLSESEILKNLVGNLALRFEDGAINGINVPKMLRDAVLALKGQKPSPDDVQKTDFALLSASVQVADGVAVNRDLKMEAPLLRVDGSGKVHLVSKEVDYKTQVGIVASLKGQKGEPLSELAGLTVPLRITGTYDKPEFGLDVASVLRDKAVQEGVRELEDKVDMPEGVKEKIPGVLDKLFKK
jgi:AsmA protein